MAKAKRKLSTKAQRREFYETVCSRLLELGAVVRREDTLGPEFAIETELGELWIWPDKADIESGLMLGSIFCRFQEPDRACERLNPRRELGGGVNPYSGKWNHYYSHGTSVEYSLDVFFSQLTALLPKEATCPTETEQPTSGRT